MIFSAQENPCLGSCGPYFYALYFDFKQDIKSSVRTSGDSICPDVYGPSLDDIYM